MDRAHDPTGPAARPAPDRDATGQGHAVGPAGPISTERVVVQDGTSATAGRIVWAPAKSLWLGAHGVLGLAGVVLYPEVGAALVFLALTAVTICAGHSVGMHRLLIHRSFEAPRWLERVLVWLGTLVGMAGPVGMIRAHDMRDWHQRQAVCPPHPSHGAGVWRDAWWQLCCEFRLDAPPRFVLEDRVRDDVVLSAMERISLDGVRPDLTLVLETQEVRVLVGHNVLDDASCFDGDPGASRDLLDLEAFHVVACVSLHGGRLCLEPIEKRLIGEEQSKASGAGTTKQK